MQAAWNHNHRFASEVNAAPLRVNRNNRRFAAVTRTTDSPDHSKGRAPTISRPLMRAAGNRSRQFARVSSSIVLHRREKPPLRSSNYKIRSVVRYRNRRFAAGGGGRGFKHPFKRPIATLSRQTTSHAHMKTTGNYSRRPTRLKCLCSPSPKNRPIRAPSRNR